MKKIRRSTGEPLTAQEALQILQSAIGYCQQAGLTVQAANSGTGLMLTIPGAYYTTVENGTEVTFALGTPPNPPKSNDDLSEKRASAQS